MTKVRMLIALVAIGTLVGLEPACSQDSDGDGDSDADSDASGDADVDADVDADGDADVDDVADGDVDADVDDVADGDADVDVDVDGDGDADGDGARPDCTDVGGECRRCNPSEEWVAPGYDCHGEGACCIPFGAEVCPPECRHIGTDREGWFWSCVGSVGMATGLIARHDCDGCSLECRHNGTDSEGWYTNCTPPEGGRIAWADCDPSPAD